MAPGFESRSKDEERAGTGGTQCGRCRARRAVPGLFTRAPRPGSDQHGRGPRMTGTRPRPLCGTSGPLSLWGSRNWTCGLAHPLLSVTLGSCWAPGATYTHEPSGQPLALAPAAWLTRHLSSRCLASLWTTASSMSQRAAQCLHLGRELVCRRSGHGCVLGSLLHRALVGQ